VFISAPCSETCIKGHRSTACKHTDRPLFEIKKKGRPVTQCEHCRELRKTKQVHVKCICELKDDSPRGLFSGAVKQGVSDHTCMLTHQLAHSRLLSLGNNKGLEGAAFPSGLPEALEASVALQPLSEGGSSDSDHSGMPSNVVTSLVFYSVDRNTGEQYGCTCKHGGDCHCCTPRKSLPRIRSKTVSDPQQMGADPVGLNTTISTTISTTEPKRKHVLPSTPTSSRNTSHVLARLAELRPVLPKPPHSDRSAVGPMHDPASRTAHGHAGRSHTHENKFFSPYGRAYDYNHAPEHVYDEDQRQSQIILHQDEPVKQSTSVTPVNEQSFRDQLQALEAAATTTWIPTSGSRSESGATAAFPSACGCGDNCRCPGCTEHDGSGVTPSPSAFSTCVNPGACAMCLDCTILSLPSSLPPDTALSIYDPYQTQSIDEWLRQVSALPSSILTLSNTSGSPASAMSQGHPYTLPLWNTFEISEPTTVPERLLVGTTCGVECICPPGLCKCKDHDHDHDYEPGSGGRNSGDALTFATSGERASCFPVRQEQKRVFCADAGMSGFEDTLLNAPGYYSGRTAHIDTLGYLTVPETPRSRSSSTSSQSSHYSTSRVSINSSGSTEHSPAIPIGRVQGPMKYTHRKVQSSHDLSIHSDANAAKSCYSSSSISLPPSAGWNENAVTDAGSNPDSEMSLDDRYSQCDPSLDGMQLQ
jgi:hypothetical protein